MFKMPRVFARKSFEFVRREKKDGVMVVAESVTTSPLSFVNLPDWVVNDPMYTWARNDGDIEVMQSREDEKVAELAASANKTSNTTGPTQPFLNQSTGAPSEKVANNNVPAQNPVKPQPQGQKQR
ncbi:MAG: hypothetical protein ACYC6C_11765 [Coriobacteriia bacterium]